MMCIVFPLYLVCVFPCIIRIIKKRDSKFCCDIVSLCAILFIVPVGRLSLPASLTMAAVCSVKMFFIAARIEEEESWISVYCETIVKCQVCK